MSSVTGGKEKGVEPAGFWDASLLFDEWVLATDEDRDSADLLVEVEGRILNHQLDAF